MYIRGICQAYTAAVHIHGINMVYTDYIPSWGSRCAAAARAAGADVAQAAAAARRLCSAGGQWRVPTPPPPIRLRQRGAASPGTKYILTAIRTEYQCN